MTSIKIQYKTKGLIVNMLDFVSHSSGFKSMLRCVYCSLVQGTLFLLCLSQPQSINQCLQFILATWKNTSGEYNVHDGLTSHPWRVAMVVVAPHYRSQSYELKVISHLGSSFFMKVNQNNKYNNTLGVTLKPQLTASEVKGLSVLLQEILYYTPKECYL